MYHPPDVLANRAFWNNRADEYIELQNISSDAVCLFSPAENAGWRVRGSVRFDFAAPINLPANGSVILAGFDPETNPGQLSAFRARFGVPERIQVLGPFSGNLQNSTGEVHLLKPGPTDPVTSELAYVVVDEVTYADRAPWPTAADGAGGSLQRIGNTSTGNDAASWIAALPSPGADPGPGPSPAISQAPESQAIVRGQRAILSTQSDGPGPVAYQWRRDGNLVSGATNTTLVFDSIRDSDAGLYSLVAVNRNGSTESAPAVLRVLQPATIVVQPESQNLRPGTNTPLRVVALGVGNLSYQWTKDGNLIPGATEDSLKLTEVKLADSGICQVVVTDSIGPSVSDPATINVLVRPTFLSQPSSMVALAGDNVAFGVEVDGLKPYGYRSRKNNVQISATLNPTATERILRLTNVQLGSAGFYSVQVTNLATTGLGTDSASATLIVMSGFDRDGQGDAWEVQYGYSTNNPFDGGLDDDGDGQDNVAEFRAGTDPKDRQSVFRIDSIEITAQGTAIGFVAGTNQGYTVQFREGVDASQWRVLGQVIAPATQRSVIYLDRLPAADFRLYRVTTPPRFE